QTMNRRLRGPPRVRPGTKAPDAPRLGDEGTPSNPSGDGPPCVASPIVCTDSPARPRIEGCAPSDASWRSGSGLVRGPANGVGAGNRPSFPQAAIPHTSHLSDSLRTGQTLRDEESSPLGAHRAPSCLRSNRISDTWSMEP